MSWFVPSVEAADHSYRNSSIPGSTKTKQCHFMWHLRFLMTHVERKYGIFGALCAASFVLGV